MKLKFDAFFLEKDKTVMKPRSYFGTLYDNVTLNCNDGTDMLWYYEHLSDHPISHPINTGSNLTITKATPMDTGHYFCHGKYPNTINSYFLAQAIVIIYG